jgi:P pilus assembly chaperone PapD
VQNAADLRKECWDIVFVEEVPQRASVKGNSLHYVFRTGVKVYVVPPGLSRDAAVEDMAVVDSSSKKQVAIRFHNTGGTHLLSKGRLEFRRLDNTLAMQVPIAEFPTLPGATRRVLMDIPPDLTAGDYVILAMIDFGGSELVAGQIDYQAK